MFLSIFCLDMTWKYNAIVHISAKWVIQPPNDCWICHDPGDPVVLLVTKLLPDCQCLTFSGTNSASDSFTLGVVFLSLVNSPGNLYPGSVVHKKGVGAGKARVSVQTLKFTGLHGCHLPSPKA